MEQDSDQKVFSPLSILFWGEVSEDRSGLATEEDSDGNYQPCNPPDVYFHPGNSVLVFLGTLPLPAAWQGQVLVGAEPVASSPCCAAVTPVGDAIRVACPNFHSLEVVLELPGLILGCLSDVV